MVYLQIAENFRGVISPAELLPMSNIEVHQSDAEAKASENVKNDIQHEDCSWTHYIGAVLRYFAR